MQHIQTINFKGIRQYILQKLENELSDQLLYHSLEHTLDVEKAAIYLAKEECLNEKDALLVQTAALFHDAGFLKAYSNNEIHGANYFSEVATKFGFSNQDITIVTDMILATHHTVVPKNIMEQIICDADHDYLGREDYYDIAENLHKELAVFFKDFEESRWVEIQYDYLKNRHRYHTVTAINNRVKTKKKRIEELEQQLLHLKK